MDNKIVFFNIQSSNLGDIRKKNNNYFTYFIVNQKYLSREFEMITYLYFIQVNNDIFKIF